jgi:hypothetical protein
MDYAPYGYQMKKEIQGTSSHVGTGAAAPATAAGLYQQQV